jgi:hypothetical protein
LRASDLTALALPKYPPSQLLHDGDTLALDVLVNPRTGVKIIDFVRVSSKGEATQASKATGVESAAAALPASGASRAKDLTADMIEMGIANSRLLVNGQQMIGTDEGRGPGVSGRLLWFYLPGHGRFILSLAPHEGYDFQKIGIVQGRKLAFEMGGNRFEWISSASIIPSIGEAVTLWVLHDPQYQPELGPDRSPYEMGSANQMKYLLAKP